MGVKKKTPRARISAAERRKRIARVQTRERERRARSEIARRGWETRRKRVAAEERARKKAARLRSEAAKKGWATRRKQERQRSQRARKGWRTRWLREARNDAADGLHGRKRADWKVLVAMIDNDDPAWIAFLKRAEELGFSSHQARDEWFSPKVM